MTIFFDASVLEYPGTGIGKSTLGLYRACVEREPSVHAIGFHRRPLRNSIPGFVQTMQYGRHIPSSVWRNMLVPMMALAQAARVIHFPWSGHVPLLLSRVKVITTLHDVLPLALPDFFKTPEEESRYRKRIQQDIFRTHLLLTDSEYSKMEILKHFSVPIEPVVLSLASTITVSEIGKGSLEKPTSDYFFYVGGYDRRKGLDILLRVFTRLHREKKLKHKLVIAGDKKFISAECDRYLGELVPAGVVQELGYISDSELARWLGQATALVYPSKFEGFGLPPLEAMTLGCPVMTTKYTSLPEICGEAVYYIEPDNEDDFALGLVTLAENENLRRELKEKGLIQAAKFSWAKTAQQYLGLVSGLENSQKNRE